MVLHTANAVSHLSSEADAIALGVGLTLAGVLSVVFWEHVFDVRHPTRNHVRITVNTVSAIHAVSLAIISLLSVVYAPHMLLDPPDSATLHRLDDNEAGVNLTITHRRPAVSRHTCAPGKFGLVV